MVERLKELNLENDIPEYVDTIVMTCLKKDPAQRPQSMQAIRDWIGAGEDVVQAPASAEESRKKQVTQLFGPQRLEWTPSIEKAIRKATEKPMGELTKTDLEKVTQLVLTNNQIGDVSTLKELKQLTHLYLSENQISDVNALKELKQLTYLHLSENQISDVSALKELTQLTVLVLSNNQISDVSPLKELRQLQELYLQNNQINDMNPLKELTELRRLHLVDNPGLTKALIAELQKALPDCKIYHNAKK